MDLKLTNEEREGLAKFLGLTGTSHIHRMDDGWCGVRPNSAPIWHVIGSDADLMLALLDKAAQRGCLPHVKEWKAGEWLCFLRVGVATQTGEANSAPMAVVLACLQLKELL